MRVAVYSSKDYDRAYFTKANEDIPDKKHELNFFEHRLDLATANLAHGYKAVCVFVNDDVGAEVVDALADQGVEVIVLRCQGCNNVNMEAVRRRGLTVANVPGYSPWAVAEHAVALLLTLNRKIHKVYNRVREGNFSLEGLTPGFDVSGKTVGVVGTGRIGAAFAQIMMGFNCHVLAYDVHQNQGLVKMAQQTGSRLEYVSMDRLLRESHIISLHVPLTPQSHHLINKDALAIMKQGAVLINTSRGPLIDTQAVITALKAKTLGGLGVDVYEEEEDVFYQDLSEDVLHDDMLARLMTFPNVILTPHEGFYTVEALTRIATVTMENLSLYEQGGEPTGNLVLRGVGRAWGVIRDHVKNGGAQAGDGQGVSAAATSKLPASS